jgi:hypothetical protein
MGKITLCKPDGLQGTKEYPKKNIRIIALGGQVWLWQLRLEFQ